MLGRVSNGPMPAATSRRIVYIRILFWYTEVYYSQYYHIIRRLILPGGSHLPVHAVQGS